MKSQVVALAKLPVSFFVVFTDLPLWNSAVDWAVKWSFQILRPNQTSTLCLLAVITILNASSKHERDRQWVNRFAGSPGWLLLLVSINRGYHHHDGYLSGCLCFGATVDCYVAASLSLRFLNQPALFPPMPFKLYLENLILPKQCCLRIIFTTISR